MHLVRAAQEETRLPAWLGSVPPRHLEWPAHRRLPQADVDDVRLQERNRPLRAQEDARGGGFRRASNPKLLRDARGRPGHTEELRPGLHGARVPGAVGADGGAFYMVKGDAASVLRCRHGQTTHTLGAHRRASGSGTRRG